ncbi:hypothetical protein F2Q69_00047301 [Brassica cretica]|uniref:DUF7755 domain-containing protein n=1 Tax=Brassica cretica TaxID=69181 RepID=A0A8S9PN90_BRACR|nr:hypothetical protein F2Q69_00047301 [Brassica cretica]
MILSEQVRIDLVHKLLVLVGGVSSVRLASRRLFRIGVSASPPFYRLLRRLIASPPFNRIGGRRSESFYYEPIIHYDKGDSLLQTILATLSRNDESFKFQRGSVDEFTFEGPELGKIRAFWISLESGQWRVGGVSLWVVYPRALGETNDVEETYCYRYDTDMILKLIISCLERAVTCQWWNSDLHRSVDELQAPGSSSSSENSNQILSGRLKVPVLSLVIGLSVLVVRGYNPTAFAVTPREIVVGTLGFLVCKVAVVLAAFKPLKDGS